MNGFGGNNFLWVIILIALLGGCGCGCGVFDTCQPFELAELFHVPACHHHIQLHTADPVGGGACHKAAYGVDYSGAHCVHPGHDHFPGGQGSVE